MERLIIIIEPVLGVDHLQPCPALGQQGTKKPLCVPSTCLWGLGRRGSQSSAAQTQDPHQSGRPGCSLGAAGAEANGAGRREAQPGPLSPSPLVAGLHLTQPVYPNGIGCKACPGGTQGSSWWERGKVRVGGGSGRMKEVREWHECGSHSRQEGARQSPGLLGLSVPRGGTHGSHGS